MLEVHNIQVLSWSLNYLDITWEIRDTYELPEDYDFYILRSESAAGPFQVLNSATPVVSPAVFAFRDGMIASFSKIRDYRYRIRAVHRSSNTIVEFGNRTRAERARDDNAVGSAGVEAAPSKVLLAINRRYEMLLRAKSGRRILLLTRMTFGRHCADCWDAELRRTMVPDCRTCWGTTFTGGYYSPVAIYAKFQPSPKGIRRSTELGEVHASQTYFELGRFPHIKSGDLLVERENIRWHVGTVQTTELRRAASRQTATVTQLERGRVEYQIPVFFPPNYAFAPEKGLLPRMDPSAPRAGDTIMESGG